MLSILQLVLSILLSKQTLASETTDAFYCRVGVATDKYKDRTSASASPYIISGSNERDSLKCTYRCKHTSLAHIHSLSAFHTVDHDVMAGGKCSKPKKLQGSSYAREYNKARVLLYFLP